MIRQTALYNFEIRCGEENEGQDAKISANARDRVRMEASAASTVNNLKSP